MPFLVHEQQSNDIQTNAEDLEKLSDRFSDAEKDFLDLRVNSLTVSNGITVGDDQTIDGNLMVEGQIQCNKNINSSQTIIGKQLRATTQLSSDNKLIVQGNSTLANVVTTGTLDVQGDTTLADVVTTGTLDVQGDTTLADVVTTGTLNVQGDTTLADVTVTGTATVGGRNVATVLSQQARVSKTNPYIVISGSDNASNPNFTPGVTYLQVVTLNTPVPVGTSDFNVGAFDSEPTNPIINLVQNVSGGVVSGGNLISVNVLFLCIVLQTGSFDQGVGVTYNLS